jgi:DNA-binding transcriptional LysR family regulator
VADRFEDLRTLLTVVAAGGINAAAAELGIAKSAVSRRVSDLEKRLGVALVDRSNRRFELTSTGSEYARRARAVLSSLDELDASVAPRSDDPVLRLRAPSVILAHAVVPALVTMRAASDGRHTRLHLSSCGGDREDERQDVLVTDLIPDGEYQRRHLRSTNLVLCAAPSHLSTHGVPRSPHDLDVQPAIVTSPEAPEWRLAGRSRAIAAVSLISEDTDAAAAAAMAGLGLAQLPDFVAAAALADGRLVAVLPGHEPPTSEIQAFFREDAASGTRRFVDALAAAFADMGRTGTVSGTDPGKVAS